MEQIIQATAPIIPVIDERLAYVPEAPLQHKAKIDQYNDLLEDVYQREVELTRYKSALTNMRQEIAEEAFHLSSTGVLPPVASATPIEGARSDSESEEAENGMSDSSGSTGDSKARRNSVGSRPHGKTGSKKAKRRFTRNSKVPEAELDAEWDYQLELGRGSGRKGMAR